MRISNVRALLLSAPIPPDRRWTSDFGTNTRQDVAIVIVETDEGLTGYGEAKGTPVVMKTLVEQVFAPQLIGEDPTRVEFLWEKMYSASRLPLALAHGRPYHRAGSRGETIHALSGIDVALWDIFGKSLDVPIYRLLGGGIRDRLPAYASGGWAAPEQTADEVRRRVPMPVSTGESETTRFAFRDIVEQRAADYLQPDVAVVGGLTEARRVGALAGARPRTAGGAARVGLGAALGGEPAVGRGDTQLRHLRVLPGVLLAVV